MIEDAVTAAAKLTGIDRRDWEQFIEKITPLKEHHHGMWTHSLRVGLYSCGLAANEGLDPKLALMGGCGHDIGKCNVPNWVLDSNQWGHIEQEEMSVHPRAGFDYLKTDFPYPAFIAGLHHQFQGQSYGVTIEEIQNDYTLSGERANWVLKMACLVATADYFDALVTRNPYAVTLSYRTQSMMALFPMERCEWLLNHQMESP